MSLRTWLYLLIAILSMTLLIGFGWWLNRQLPLPANHVQSAAKLLDAHGQVITTLEGQQSHRDVPLADIAPHFLQATIAIEDRRFYQHAGLDWRGIGRAIFVNLAQRRKAQGASTITQQLVRNLYLSHEKTWSRKYLEALFSMRMEAQWSKQDILTQYVNRIYYGHGLYGIEAAAAAYFNKSAKQLTLAESALLAGVPKGPRYYSPRNHFAQAKKRQRTVLQAMHNAGYITNDAALQAAKAKLHIHPATQPEHTKAPYFSDYIRYHVLDQLGLERAKRERSGLHIWTTLDLEMQRFAEKIIAKQLQQHPSLQASLIALDPRNGHIKAMVGGVDYTQNQFNRTLSITRQPGSTFKPFVYLHALLHGAAATTKHRSEPMIFSYDDGKKTYAPKNFADKYAHDWIDMRRAIAVSDNIYAVQTLQEHKPDGVIELCRKLGITSVMQPLPSLALGSFPISSLELAGAYAVFAHQGKYSPPVAITQIVDTDERVLYQHQPQASQKVPAEHAFVLTKLLESVFANGGTAHRVAHLIKRPVAGKTGTTDSDAWMVGYTPELVTVVWLGYDSGQPIRSADAYLATPIFAEFMEQALSHVPPKMFAIPDHVVSVYVDETTGQLAAPDCGQQRLEHFVSGTEPQVSCSKQPLPAPLPRYSLPFSEDAMDQSWMEQFKKWWRSD